jgi:ABC-2 type transport system permease protein
VSTAIARPSPLVRARRFLLRVRALSRKEWMHISRDVSTIAFAAVMPLILLVLFGFAVSFDVDNIRAVVVDQDRTAASRSLADHLFSGPTFTRAGEAPDAEAVEPWFRTRRASVGIVIPREFERRLQRGEAVTVQVLVDAADNVTTGSVLSYTARFVTQQNREMTARVVGRAPEAIEARVRALFNPAMRSAVFLVPGLVALIQAIMAVMLTSLTVAREWERGSMEQLFSTPVGRLEIALGKLGPYFIVAFGQLLIILAAATWIFDVPLRGSLVALFAVSSLFLYAALSQGLLISVITKNQQVATQVAAVSSMLPSMLLSGFALPIDNMPWLLQKLTNIVPARHYVHAIRGIMLRDVEPAALAGDALKLALIGTALLALATARFQRRLA